MPHRPPSLSFAPEPGRDDSKAERDAFYTGRRWRALRLLILARMPLCAECGRAGLTVAAELVHHVVDRLDDPSLAYETSNLESSCNPCHTRRHKRKHRRPPGHP